jgi:Uma2 family endonuclease
MATTKLMTAEEFARITEIGRFDLIDGELISMSPAGGYQGEVASQFVAALVEHSRRQPGKVYTAEASFILQRDPDVVLAPDAAFVRASRLPPLAERLGFLPVAPDLAVEIVSPSDRMTAVRRKISTYLMLGTPLVVMVEPRHRRVTLFRPGREPRVLHEGDMIDGDDILPGFQLPVAKLFE